MKRSVARKTVTLLLAGCFAFGSTFAAYDLPRAEAGLFDIGDILQAGINIAQARDTVKNNLMCLIKQQMVSNIFLKGRNHKLESMMIPT